VQPLFDLEATFPNLAAAGYTKTSDKTDRPPQDGAYNCIAWAANDPRCWWWPTPDGYWPPWIRTREVTISCFVRTFRSLGYVLCISSRQEFGYEKVALYAMPPSRRMATPPNNLQDLRHWEPKHMARQLPDGTWTSKCGGDEDITHFTLDALECYGPPYLRGEYGCPVLYMKRLIPISWLVRLAQQIFWKFEKV
jgi:hypothetical protein